MLTPTQLTLIIVNATFSTLSLLTAATRLHRTVLKARTVQLHDVFLIAALICGITEAVLQSIATRFGLGLIIHDYPALISQINIPMFFKFNIAFFVSYFACNMFVKLSLLAFYRKLSPDKKYNWMLYTMAFIAIGFGLGSIMATLLACTPLSKLWQNAQPGKCIDIKAFYYFNASFMIANDIILYILPIVIVRRVQLSKAKAAAMNFLFALGFVVVVASAFRLLAIYNLFSTPTESLYYQAKLLIWCTVENHLALIIVCLPACKAAVVAVSPSLSSSPASVWSRIVGSHKRSGSKSTLPSHSRTISGATASTSSSPHKPKRGSKPWFAQEWTTNSSEDSSMSQSRMTSITAGHQHKGRELGADEIELKKEIFISVEEDVSSIDGHLVPDSPTSVYPEDHKSVV